ncbi:chromate transporter [Dorea formicigenerans]|uniref:chromate transporter n=1 Tax=Dorea formicigenerans TaxID=39486 RepID=UPI0015701C36|nr:chromate transporter [Dorea formicigenerans]NSK20456.1 chromate transporter [Dorea formicigenerans]
MIYLKLFWSFFQIGLFSFGGGYAAVPLIQSQIVETNQWMSMSQFADLITMAEITPGPIVVNCATFVGQQIAGLSGAIVCTSGCVLPSVLIVLALSWMYMKFRNLSIVQGVLIGLRPTIVAMIASAGFSLLLLALFNTSLSELVLSDFRFVECVIFAACLVLLRKFKVNPIKIIFGSGIVGIVVYLLLETAEIKLT